jgi:predicted nucleic acid-binding protein
VNGPVLLDTGPLVAFLKRRDQYHSWARERFEEIKAPLLTCEPVLTEACFLLQRSVGGPQAVLNLVVRGVVSVSFPLREEIVHVAQLLDRYANVPMSLADACLVRMAEKYKKGAVFTLDRDFKIYRKSGRQAVLTIMPDEW